MDFQRTVLDNGVRIVTSRMEHVRSATLIFYVGTGGRHETDDQAGISHFLEHMIFKGTPDRPDPAMITQEIEGVGGILNAATGREHTNYWVKVPSDHVESSFNVLADALTHSLIDETELEKERSVIFEEINGIHDTPDDYIHDVIDELVWDGQPVGRPIIGTAKTVGAITRDNIVEYLDTQYRPNQLVISAAGDIHHDQIVELADRAFGTMKTREPARMETSQILQKDARAQIIQRETEEAHLCIAMPAISYTDDRRFAQDMIDAILSSGMSSRLFQEIRENRGLAYVVFGMFRGYVDIGQGVIYAGTDPKKIEETIGAILDELCKLRDIPVPHEEMERTRQLRKGRIVMGLEDSRAVAGWIGSQELLYKDILSPEEVMAEIDSVETADVQALAQQLFVPERLNLAVVGPYQDEDAFRKMLKL